MDDQVILFIGDKKFLLGINEALSISRVLCGASRIHNAWIQGQDSRKCNAIGDPDPQAATIAPISGVLQLEIDSNMKILEERNKL
jgi:hypothetical protein